MTRRGSFMVTITGFKELERALAEDLPKATAKGVLRRSAIKAMKPLEAYAKSKAPRDTAELVDGITTKVARAKRQRGSVRFARQSGVEVLTGPTTGGEAGGKGAWQEFGTVDQPPHPYVRPAGDAEGEKVVETVKQILTDQIDKAVKRIARRNGG